MALWHVRVCARVRVCVRACVCVCACNCVTMNRINIGGFLVTLRESSADLTDAAAAGVWRCTATPDPRYSARSVQLCKKENDVTQTHTLARATRRPLTTNASERGPTQPKALVIKRSRRQRRLIARSVLLISARRRYIASPRVSPGRLMVGGVR